LIDAREQHRYCFTTCTGAKLEKSKVTDTSVDWVMRTRHHRLELLAMRAQGGLLHKRTINRCTGVWRKLYVQPSRRLPEMNMARELLSGTGRNVGLEVQGDVGVRTE
jgi:hypothetical protein